MASGHAGSAREGVRRNAPKGGCHEHHSSPGEQAGSVRSLLGLESLEPHDVGASFSDNRLTVSGKREEERREEKEAYCSFERAPRGRRLTRPGPPGGPCGDLLRAGRLGRASTQRRAMRRRRDAPRCARPPEAGAQSSRRFATLGALGCAGLPVYALRGFLMSTCPTCRTEHADGVAACATDG